MALPSHADVLRLVTRSSLLEERLRGRLGGRLFKPDFFSRKLVKKVSLFLIIRNRANN